MKLGKTLVCLFMLVVLILQGISFCFADNVIDSDTQTDTRFTQIATTSCSLSISGITSTSYAKVTSISNNNLHIRLELQKLKSGSYSKIQTWNTSGSGTTLSISKTRLINVLSTYRLKATFTAGSETVTAYAYP